MKIIKEISEEFGLDYGKEVIGMKYKGGSKNGGIDWEYFDKYNPILEVYMESCGDGKSKASQIVTAVNKLIYKWYNNGDVYDNDKKIDGLGWFNDLSPYANWLYENTDDEVKKILDRIYDIKTVAEYEHILKDLADRCMDKNYLSKFEKAKKVGSIYEYSGKFKFDRRK